MNVYLDTSAFVPMMVREPGTDACRRMWEGARQIVSTRLLPVEAAAALATAVKVGRLRSSVLGHRLERLRELRKGILWIELDPDLSESSVLFAANFGLRGYDAVHCAAGASMGAEDTVLASGDKKMLAIWDDLGFSTFDTNQDL